MKAEKKNKKELHEFKRAYYDVDGTRYNFLNRNSFFVPGIHVQILLGHGCPSLIYFPKEKKN